MIIREATVGDVPFIVEEGIKFLKYHPANFNNISNEYLEKLAVDLITNHIIFVTEDNNNLIGMIAGMIVPNMYNPTDKVLQELFWWVKEEYRKSSAALKLFIRFEKAAKEYQVNFISMSSTVYTPQLDTIYKKFGYIPMEISYIKEL